MFAAQTRRPGTRASRPSPEPLLRRAPTSPPTTSIRQFATRSSLLLRRQRAHRRAPLGLLGAANFIVAKRTKTCDLTNKKIYTLAPQTLSTLKALKEPVNAIGFLPAGHPVPRLAGGIFQRYQNESPRSSAGSSRTRAQPGPRGEVPAQGGPGDGGAHPRRGRRGDAHRCSTSSPSRTSPTPSSSSTRSASRRSTYLVGHGEWPLDEARPSRAPSQVSSAAEFKKQLLQEGYAPEELNLAERQNEIPKDAAVVVIAGARSPFSDAEKAALEQVPRGGRPGALLRRRRRRAGPRFAAREVRRAGRPGPGRRRQDQPAQPLLIVSAFFGEHEVTQMLKQLKMNVELPMARGLSVLREGLAPGATPVPVVLTSPVRLGRVTPNDEPKLTDGEKAGQIPLVVVSSRDTNGAPDKRFDEARLVVFGDSEILLDELWGHEPDRNLVLNALAWASTQVNKITIRPPDRDISTIDMDEPRLAKIRFIAMDLLPLSLLGIGLAIWLARRNK